jgi:hypothetical protein
MALLKEVYNFKMDLVTNVSVIDNAMRFIASEKQKLKDAGWVPRADSTLVPSQMVFGDEQEDDIERPEAND